MDRLINWVVFSFLLFGVVFSFVTLNFHFGLICFWTVLLIGLAAAISSGIIGTAIIHHHHRH